MRVGMETQQLTNNSGVSFCSHRVGGACSSTQLQATLSATRQPHALLGKRVEHQQRSVCGALWHRLIL